MFKINDNILLKIRDFQNQFLIFFFFMKYITFFIDIDSRNNKN